MAENEENFSFTGDSLNESFIKSFTGGKSSTAPTVPIDKISISKNGEVIAKQGTSNNATQNNNTKE